jgi:Fe-S cluster assembly iron-binding protein IscA
MLTVTERAAQELKGILEAHAVEPEQVLRLVRETQGFSLRLDKEGAGDEVVESEGATILLIDEQLSPIVDGAVVDCIDTPEGPRLTITKE